MKNIIIGLSLLITSVKARNNCWAEAAGFPCCPRGYKVVEEEGYWGDWGIFEGQWCGILHDDEKAWSQVINEDYLYCSYGVLPYLVDQDGIWGWDEQRNQWCGMKNSTQLWNNREAVKKTKKEWDKFKIDWDNDLKYDFTRISVFVGQDESKLNFGWYSTK